MKNQKYTSGAVLFFITIFAATNLLSTEARSVSDKGTKATLTINSFEKGGSGGGPSECDGQYHSNDTPIVALSTRWYDNGKRCMDYIVINANGRSTKAMVVDECDSTRGCKNDIVDASRAVWKALKVKHSDWGEMEVTWSDA